MKGQIIMEYIHQPSMKLPVTGRYDVVVAGGGIAGVSAALAAARQGAKVLLIEKQFMLGGLATLGLITIYLPLCDGMGKQVSFGISEELLRLSIKHGYEDKYPTPWLEEGSVEDKSKIRFEVQYNPYVFAIEMEQLLLKEGVEILYGSSVCSTLLEGQKINALIIENKSGRSAIKVKAVVDASGDADIAYQSGAKTEIFKQKNVLAGWYYYLQDNSVKLKMLGFSDIPDKYKDKEKSDSNVKRYTGLDGKELSEMVIDSHKLLLSDFLKGGGINESYALTTVATIPQVRMTRKILGNFILDDTQMHSHFDDSIGMISDWRKRGPIYEVPFSTLYGNEIKNLITAGRCISVTDAMWDISRVIPACAVTGQAAGTAAAISDDFTTLDVTKLQNLLTENGVKLHLNEL